MLRGRLLRGALLVSAAPALWAATVPTATPVNGGWNPKSAAAYLDRRAEWWMAWPGAARDHHTFCISCHTALAYSLARPALRAAMGETGPSASEVRLLDNVRERVRLWQEVKPYYGGNNASRSRGTEAVLNGLLLVADDARAGKLGNDTRAALDNLWALQQTAGDARGAWEWIQFDNEPWEAHDSQYYGAALAAIAVGAAREQYRPQIQNRAQSLRDYLNREFARQSPINQAVALWASANWPDLLAPERRKALIDDLKGMQQTDGGWSVASLIWGWRDWNFTTLAKLWVHSEATPLHPKSDGYATGLIALAFEKSGLPNDDPSILRARAWLARNQRQTEGRWPAYSPNGKRNHSDGKDLFMDDAATAYAVLALTAK